MPNKSNASIRLAIAIPTYNEITNIKELISKIKVAVKKAKVPCTILIIDDNSPDGTGVLADKLAMAEKTKDFTIKVLHRKVKEGLGKAYAAGINELLDQDFTHILQMDADLSHDPAYIQNFIEEAHKGKDFVSASRYMEGGGIADWGLLRRILSRGGNIYTRMFLGNTVTDYTNGLNMFTTKLLKTLNVDNLNSAGYGFFIELKYKALEHSKNYAQIPIILTDRQNGKSKIPKNTIFINFVLVPKLRFSNRKKIK